MKEKNNCVPAFRVNPHLESMERKDLTVSPIRQALLLAFWYNLFARTKLTMEARTILKTYFLAFKVIPHPNNVRAMTVAGAIAHFWIVDSEPDRAVLRAEQYLQNSGWLIQDMEQQPLETTAKHFSQREIGLKYFRLAQQKGLAVYLLGWSKDGVSVEIN